MQPRIRKISDNTDRVRKQVVYFEIHKIITLVAIRRQLFVVLIVLGLTGRLKKYCKQLFFDRVLQLILQEKLDQITKLAVVLLYCTVR